MVSSIFHILTIITSVNSLNFEIPVDFETEKNNLLQSHTQQVSVSSYEITKSFEEEVEDKFNQELSETMEAFRKSNQKLFVEMNEENNLPLRRFTYTSKYLWDHQNATVKSYEELKRKCESFKLVMPEVRHDGDFRSIANYLTINPELVIALSLNDKKAEGHFVEADGQTKISYQMFGYGEPDNLGGLENCVTIRKRNEGDVIMQDVNCKDMNVHVVCQRRKNSFGYEESAENAAMENEGLAMISDTGNRRYYVSQTQKPWVEANKFCSDSGKQLFDLELNETSNQYLYMSIAKWRGLKGLKSHVGYWTSGRFSKSPQEDFLTWKSNANSFDLHNKQIQWEWANGEPADQSGVGLELCVDLSLPHTPGKTGFVPKLRVSNCKLPFYFVCYEEFQVDSNCQENGQMKFIGINSKFLFDLSQTQLLTREEAKDRCEKWDYQIAEIESIADLSQVWAFVQASGFQSREWHLGINDKDMEGEFFDSSGEKILYQAFSASEPDNKDNEDCVMLKTGKHGLIMEDRKCEEKGFTLCQYQKDSSCFASSAENVRKPVDELVYFGETAIGRFFLSSTQKTWLEAMEFCNSRKKKLLDLVFIGELHNLRNQYFYPKLIAWAKKYKTGIWTSGRYLKSVEDGEFRWESTLEMFRNDDKSINFTWLPGEPSDSTNRRLEICIELEIEDWANSKPGDTLIPVLKAANCKLPNYFVCYEDAPHLKNCHMPPNIDFNLRFKALSETARYVYVDTPKKMNSKDGSKVCKDWGLESAEISSLRDYKTVSDALESWNVTNNFFFGLGLNSIGTEGLWYEGDGKTPIRFQVFGPLHPLYYENFEPVDHVVFNKFKSKVWKMTAISGLKNTNVLCQFKRDSTCSFAKIFTYIDKNVPKDYLIKLKYNEGRNSSSNLTYYIADSQKTWEEAMRFCWSRNKQLLDLKSNAYQAQTVYSLLADWLKRKELHPQVIKFWTSGKYVGHHSDQQFRWETSGSFVRHIDLANELDLKIIPPPLSTAKNDRCITLGLDSLEPIDGKYRAQLKVSNCNIPYFIVCSENNPVNKSPEKVIRTTPTLPKVVKNLPSCKPFGDEKRQKLQETLKKWVMSQRPPGYVNCESDNLSKLYLESPSHETN